MERINEEMDSKQIPFHTKIADLNLSAQLIRILNSAEISTLDELLNTDYEKLREIRNMGNTRLKELGDYIHGLGYTLLNEATSISSIKSQLRSAGFILLEDYGFSDRLCFIFYQNGIYTMGDLIKYGSRAYSLAGIGQSMQNELKNKLADRGVVLENHEKNAALELLNENKERLLNGEDVVLSADISAILIKNLDLSVKLIKILNRARIVTLGELLNTDYERLEKIRNLGPVCLKELKDYVHSIGYKLLNEDKYHPLEGEVLEETETVSINDRILAEGTSSILIDDLEVSQCIKNGLRRTKIYTLEDLLNTDYQKIKKIRNLGEGYLKELKNYIHSLGYALLNEDLFISEKVEQLKKEGHQLLEDYGFSSPVYLTLYRNDIYTMRDLIEYGYKVYSLKGFGSFRQEELESKLLAYGIVLTKKNEEDNRKTDTFKCGAIQTQSEIAIPDLGIADLNFTVKIQKILVQNNIYTLEELVNYGPAVYGLDGFDFDDAAIIKARLKEYHIEFSRKNETDEVIPVNDSYVEVLRDMKSDNDMIRIRYQRKKQLLDEYRNLILERTVLLEKEEKLDRKITEQIEKLQKEIKSYGRKKK